MQFPWKADFDTQRCGGVNFGQLGERHGVSCSLCEVHSIQAKVQTPPGAARHMTWSGKS